MRVAGRSAAGLREVVSKLIEKIDSTFKQYLYTQVTQQPDQQGLFRLYLRQACCVVVQF